MVAEPAVRRPIFPSLSSEESRYLGEVFRRETVAGLAAVLAAASR